jgi:hypothetical protein
MITRRRFVGALAGLTAVTALAGAGIRLPKRADVPEFDMSKYLTGPDAWHPIGWSNNLGTPAALTQKAIDDMLHDVMMRGQAFYRIDPTKLIVPPRLAERAEYVLTHRPTLFERAVWWLFPEPA